MLFNSLSFAVFLPIVFVLYWITPHKFRWLILLLSSYWFYMNWKYKYIVLILFITAVSYFSALAISRSKNKKAPVCFAVISSFALLFVFKYFNFFSESFCGVLRLFSINVEPLLIKSELPVGISFYTFQAISYVLDVYKEKVQAEHHFGKYAAFISFFPQLVAGPIERTENLLPQIKHERKFGYDKATYGLKLMFWGYFKKVVVADTLARYVDEIFNNLSAYNGFVLITAVFYFAVQIYCDFSGYSDIAIGTANLFGIDLMTNFKSPYFSSSIKEFWGRWHISLSTWFRDYVYIPLGGNRCGKLRHSINLLATFLLSGLWHGANWTFVIWGGIHGALQASENFIFGKNQRKNVLKIFVVFALVCLAWVFFRAQSLHDALYVFSNMFKGISNPISYIKIGLKNTGGKKPILVYLLILAAYDALSLKYDCIAKLGKLPLVLRWSVYYVLAFVFFYVLLIANSNTTATQFIYFQF